MGSSESQPSLVEVAEFLRRFSGVRQSTVITAETLLDADLGITGDDGRELLEEAARHFDVRLAGQDGYRTTFGLGPHEVLFGGEGLDLLGISGLAERAAGNPKPVVRDLAVGRLHEVICCVKRPTRMRYGITTQATDFTEKSMSDRRVRFLKAILFFVPRANPDNERLYPQVRSWALELDADGWPQREVGLDASGKPLFRAPDARNTGFWPDLAKKQVDESELAPLSADAFDVLWSAGD